MIIRQHAINRFMERAGCKSPEKATATLLRMAEQGVLVTLKPRYRAISLINHQYRDAEYRRYDHWMLVIEDGELATIYRADNLHRFAPAEALSGRA
jgi:hypothetical protein